jgi:predicted nucleotidyltransferase
MSLTAFLQKVVEILDEAGVQYMLTGSLAAAYYAVPRATQDIDLVLETEAEGVNRLVGGLLAEGWYVDKDAALEALRSRGQFNTIDPESGWKADFLVRKERPYSFAEFGRRQRISILGVDVTVASVEDVLISKLEWARLGDSALQRRDVVQLLERSWSRLDHTYLKKWIAPLGLESEWNTACAQAGQSQVRNDTE